MGKVLHTDLFKQIHTSAGLSPLSPSFLGLAKLLMMEFVQAQKVLWIFDYYYYILIHSILLYSNTTRCKRVDIEKGLEPQLQNRKIIEWF